MVRELGHSESIYLQILEQNGYNVVQAATVKGKINIKKFESAMIHLQKKFKVLQTGIKQKNSKPHFEVIQECQNIMLDNFKKLDKKSHQMKDVFDEEIKHGFKTLLNAPDGFLTNLLWNVTLLYNDSNDSFDVILFSSHMILDGKSICLIMGKLLEFVDCLNNEKEIEIGEFVEYSTTIDELIPKIDDFKPEIKEKKDRGEIVFDDPLTVPRGQEITFRKFNAEKLLKLCKEYKITANSIAFAAFYIGFIEAYCTIKDNQWMEIAIPVCLRKKTNIAPDAIGVFGTHVCFDVQWKECYRKMKPTDIWNLASKIQKGVQREIKKDECLTRVHPNSLVSNSKYGRDLYPCLSNIGRVDVFFEDLIELKVVGLYTSVSASLAGPVGMAHLTTLENQFYFAFTTATPVNSKERMEKFADETITVLENLTKN
eukprot:gene7277-11595_t